MDNYRKPPPNDYLKYWRVIRYFVKSKYGVTTSELDMLMFLYSDYRLPEEVRQQESIVRDIVQRKTYDW